MTLLQTRMAANMLRAALLIGMCGAAITSCTQPPSRRTVVVYTSADQEYAEVIFAAFQKKHPEVLVLPRYDSEATKTTGLVERLRAERDNPQADVFWSSEVFLTQKLADEGLLQAWESDATRDWPAIFRDPQGRWYGLAARARVVAYDPERVKDPPRYWRDLADPRFKGRVVMADPNYGTTRGHVAAWFVLWGTDKATEFLEALKANDIRIVSGNSQAAREVAQGLADLALTDTDDVWALQRNSHRISLVYPRHGDRLGHGTLFIPNTVSLVAGRPDNPDAQLFAEYLLSSECQKLLNESDSHNIPILPREQLDEFPTDARYVVPDPLMVNPADAAAVMDAAMQAVDAILLSRDR
ncbi:MAG: extracellular solute-binding protein [Phycisphaerales bacterium]|nr:extracellular solute-binding protein [Phycisphaerales bacterium]